MNRLEIDMHGLTIKQSRIEFFNIFEKALRDRVSRVTIITGNGPIKEEILRLLEDHNISWNFVPTNNGCIVAYFYGD
jgi:DNA-nicking Smr family endonuclease